MILQSISMILRSLLFLRFPEGKAEDGNMRMLMGSVRVQRPFNA